MLSTNQGITTPDISMLIDKRSEVIWKEVNNHFNISLEFHGEPNYRCYSIGKTAILYVTRDSYNKDYFAHEILHIYLETKGINIGSYLILRFKENSLLLDIFSIPLLEHISNILDHIKMFQLYMNMGFDRKKFILDYHEPKCTEHEINLITLFINSNLGLWKISADAFLGKFFAIKGCPNNAINYTSFLNELNQIDTVLFKILDDFWNTWLAFDIEKYNIRDYNYWDLCDNFYTALNAWAINKTALVI